MTEAVQAVVGTIMIVGALMHYESLHSMCDLKAAQINVQCSLNWEFMLYKFEQSHNAVEATKNVCCAKSESTVDHSKVIRWFKKFCSGCKNVDAQLKSGRSKIMDFKAVLQVIEANLVSSTWRLFGLFSILQFSLVHHLYGSNGNERVLHRAVELCFLLPKYGKTFDST